MSGIPMSSTDTKTGEKKSSSDPYPIGGTSDLLDHSPLIRHCGELNMMLRTPMVEANSDDGLHMSIDAGMDGSVRMTIDVGDGPDHYMIKPGDLFDALIAVHEARTG
jgi:hypothetical protein